MSSNIRISRICTHCKKEFEAKTVVTRYCSNTCNRKHYKEIKRQEKIWLANKLIVPIRVNSNANNQHFSIPDSARILGVSERTIFRLIQRSVQVREGKRFVDMIAENMLKSSSIIRQEVDSYKVNANIGFNSFVNAITFYKDEESAKEKYFEAIATANDLKVQIYKSLEEYRTLRDTILATSGMTSKLIKAKKEFAKVLGDLIQELENSLAILIELD